jgi:RNA polymerase sigma-70 factor, ECF subfamily
VEIAVTSSGAADPPDDYHGAVAAVVHREGGRVFAIAYSILRDQAEAEDATQETFIRAWRSWRWENGTEPSSSWLTRVCVNHCLNRQRGLFARLKLVALAEQSSGSGRPTESSGHLDLLRAFAALSIRQRTAVALHYYYGYSVADCAGLMRCRPGTVRRHLARGLAGLRKGMSDE